jgi:hypothetical protein
MRPQQHRRTPSEDPRWSDPTAQLLKGNTNELRRNPSDIPYLTHPSAPPDPYLYTPTEPDGHLTTPTDSDGQYHKILNKTFSATRSNFRRTPPETTPHTQNTPRNPTGPQPEGTPKSYRCYGSGPIETRNFESSFLHTHTHTHTHTILGGPTCPGTHTTHRHTTTHP